MRARRPHDAAAQYKPEPRRRRAPGTLPGKGRRSQAGKAGRRRHKGKRPITRAVAKNPVDHPMGGGEGRTSGGGHPMSPWGVLAKGFKTRPKYKPSNRWILVRRDGRPMKQR